MWCGRQAHCLLTHLQVLPRQLWEQSSDLASYQPVQEAGFHQAFARAPTHPVHCPTMQSWTPWLKEDAKPWALLF